MCVLKGATIKQDHHICRCLLLLFDCCFDYDTIDQNIHRKVGNKGFCMYLKGLVSL